jgi:hypothetical protein
MRKTNRSRSASTSATGRTSSPSEGSVSFSFLFFNSRVRIIIAERKIVCEFGPGQVDHVTKVSYVSFSLSFLFFSTVRVCGGPEPYLGV